MRIPRFVTKGIGRLDRGLMKIGNPTGKAGARIAGIQNIGYGAELGAGAYGLHAIHKLKQRREAKRSPIQKLVRRVKGK